MLQIRWLFSDAWLSSAALMLLFFATIQLTRRLLFNG